MRTEEIEGMQGVGLDGVRILSSGKEECEPWGDVDQVLTRQEKGQLPTPPGTELPIALTSQIAELKASQKEILDAARQMIEELRSLWKKSLSKNNPNGFAGLLDHFEWLIGLWHKQYLLYEPDLLMVDDEELQGSNFFEAFEYWRKYRVGEKVYSEELLSWKTRLEGEAQKLGEQIKDCKNFVSWLEGINVYRQDAASHLQEAEERIVYFKQARAALLLRYQSLRSELRGDITNCEDEIRQGERALEMSNLVRWELWGRFLDDAWLEIFREQKEWRGRGFPARSRWYRIENGQCAEIPEGMDEQVIWDALKRRENALMSKSLQKESELQNRDCDHMYDLNPCIAIPKLSSVRYRLLWRKWTENLARLVVASQEEDHSPKFQRAVEEEIACQLQDEAWLAIHRTEKPEEEWKVEDEFQPRSLWYTGVKYSWRRMSDWEDKVLWAALEWRAEKEDVMKMPSKMRLEFIVQKEDREYVVFQVERRLEVAPDLLLSARYYRKLRDFVSAVATHDCGRGMSMVKIPLTDIRAHEEEAWNQCLDEALLAWYHQRGEEEKFQPRSFWYRVVHGQEHRVREIDWKTEQEKWEIASGGMNLRIRMVSKTMEVEFGLQRFDRERIARQLEQGLEITFELLKSLFYRTLFMLRCFKTGRHYWSHGFQPPLYEEVKDGSAQCTFPEFFSLVRDMNCTELFYSLYYHEVIGKEEIEAALAVLLHRENPFELKKDYPESFRQDPASWFNYVRSELWELLMAGVFSDGQEFREILEGLCKRQVFTPGITPGGIVAALQNLAKGYPITKNDIDPSEILRDAAEPGAVPPFFPSAVKSVEDDESESVEDDESIESEREEIAVADEEEDGEDVRLPPLILPDVLLPAHACDSASSVEVQFAAAVAPLLQWVRSVLEQLSRVLEAILQTLKAGGRGLFYCGEGSTEAPRAPGCAGLFGRRHNTPPKNDFPVEPCVSNVH